MRSKTPLWGTPVVSPGMSLLTRLASLPKSTAAWNGLMSPAASACDCARSRHQAGSLSVSELGVPGTGSCALKRKATSKKAGGLGTSPAPPGVVALRLALGSRYLPVELSHRPTAAARRTLPLGFHLLRGT